MEYISSLSNWKLTVRREEDHIAILRAVTCDRKAVLPDELWGLPVTVLGDHALAPHGASVAGEEVRLTCGREDGDWDNRRLEDLTLPGPLVEVQDYGLYGCRDLQVLRFHDGIRRWGGGSLMNCRSLHVFFVTRIDDRDGESLAFLCDEIHDELDVTIRQMDGTETRLIFPDYIEEYEENCPAHHFDYKIYGGGHPYHHVFKAKQLSLRDYDALWGAFLKEAHEEDTALRMAWTRLRYPSDLADWAEEQYESYLAEHKEEGLLWLLSRRDQRGLALFLERMKPGEEALYKACDRARQDHNTEALALLLEHRRPQTPRGLDCSFDL